MGKKRLLLLICLLCIGMLGLICWSVTAQQQSPSQLHFQVGNLALKPYHDQEQNKYCLFLPSFAGPEELNARHEGLGTLAFSSGGVEYSQLGQVPLDQDVTMAVSFPWGARDTYTLRLMQCSARETIYIETQEGTMSMVDADQANEASVAVTFLDDQGQASYQGHAVISGRGNGTWQWPKKPYDLKLPETVTVGSLEDVDKLCLLAEYMDYSKLRNALAYRAGKTLDIPYASGYEFADVYIDGVYNGIYGLTTKREYTRHTASDGIQSVFELSTSYKGNYFYTDHQTQIRIHYGTLDSAVYYAESFEDALKARGWDTLWQIADLTSWARKYALDEFLYNYDLPLTSQYFYVGESGKIQCMLPWDYEWVLYARMSPYDFNQEQALAAYYSHGNWYEILLENEDFRLAVAKILQEEFTDSFFSSLETYMHGCTQELTGSWHCDRYRWDSSYAAGPHSDGGAGLMTYYANTFRSNFDSRRTFLLSVLKNWEDYRLLLFFHQEGDLLKQSNLQLIVPAGTPIADYYPQILTTLTNLRSAEPLSVTTGDGTALAEIGEITENLTITVIYPPES